MRFSHAAVALITALLLSVLLISCTQTRPKENIQVVPTSTQRHLNIILIDSIYIHDLEVEINDTRKNMKETEKHKGGVWHQGDKEFYYHWYSGLIHEKQTNYDSAQHYYHKALAVRRHEMGTYYVKYPLGRVLFLSGDTLNGRKYINQYIAEVTYEINHPDEQEWSMIAETVKAYRHEIKEAIYFLERRKANNVTNQ